MLYTGHWRNAVTASLCLHLLIFIAVGFFNKNLTVPVPAAEVMLEMDLVSDLSADRSGNSPAAPDAALPQGSQPQARKAAPAPAGQSPVIQASSPPVVTTGGLAMTAAGPAPAAAAPAAGSTGDSEGNPAAASATAESDGSPSVIDKPGILFKVEPAYPVAARRAGQEGTTLLQIEILANGLPGEISVVRSSGCDLLDEAAVTAVRKWQFAPAKDRSSGRAVACYTTLPVSFNLR